MEGTCKQGSEEKARVGERCFLGRKERLNQGKGKKYNKC